MLEPILLCSVALIAVALYGFYAKRHMVKMIISIEILINAANLLIVAFGAYRTPGYVELLPQSLAILSISSAGGVTAVALALMLAVYKVYGTVDVRKLRRLRG